MNSEVVHGVPTRPVILREGDIVGLDIGMRWPAERGLYTDTAVTVPVGAVSAQAQRLMEVTRAALDAAIAVAQYRHRVSEISTTVQRIVEDAGYSIVRDLVGHGVGRAPHEPPQVPNFWERDAEDTVLTNGLVIAIEPMVNAGGWRVRTMPDRWTVVSADGSLSAHFEHTILVTKERTEVLTAASRNPLAP